MGNILDVYIGFRCIFDSDIEHPGSNGTGTSLCDSAYRCIPDEDCADKTCDGTAGWCIPNPSLSEP